MCQLAATSSQRPASTATSDASQQRSQQQQQQQPAPRALLRPAALSAAVLLASAGAAHAEGLGPAGAHALELVLRPLFSAFTFLYIIRIPMTWYPSIDGTKLPWLLAYAPTEPVLRATRNVIPLVGGVDVTPIVWVGLLSFFSEILLGPQGILMLIQRETGAGLL